MIKGIILSFVLADEVSFYKRTTKAMIKLANIK